MLEPAVEAVTLNFIEKLLAAKPSEKFALAGKRIKAFEKSDVWDTLNKQEKKDAKKLIISGWTIQQVVDALEDSDAQ